MKKVKHFITVYIVQLTVRCIGIYHAHLKFHNSLVTRPIPSFSMCIIEKLGTKLSSKGMDG